MVDTPGNSKRPNVRADGSRVRVLVICAVGRVSVLAFRYIAELKKLEDSSRYLYEMQIKSGSGKDDGEDKRFYKRYKLSDEKTFGSLFFDEKEQVRCKGTGALWVSPAVERL